MKKRLLAATVAIFACCFLIVQAQEGTKPASPKSAQAEKGDQKNKGRLPNNYGKLGLSEPQKTKIYGIQNQYDDQLDVIEKQFAALKAKRDQEVEAVLTDDQRKVLKTMAEVAKEKAKPKKEDAPGSASKPDGSAAKAPTEEKK